MPDALFFDQRLEDLDQLVGRLLTRRRTRPSELRSSKITTRMTRWPTIEMWMLVFSPSWNWAANSFSVSSLAMPPVAATLPAVSEASDVVSRCSTSPACGDGLAVLVDDEDDLGVGVSVEDLADVVDLLELLLVHDELLDHRALAPLGGSPATNEGSPPSSHGTNPPDSFNSTAEPNSGSATCRPAGERARDRRLVAVLELATDR